MPDVFVVSMLGMILMIHQNSLFFNSIVERCEKPDRQKSHDIPDDQAGKKSIKSQNILARIPAHVPAMHHQTRTHSGKHSRPRKTHDIDDADPGRVDFQQMINIDHNYSFI